MLVGCGPQGTEGRDIDFNNLPPLTPEQRAAEEELDNRILENRRPRVVARNERERAWHERAMRACMNSWETGRRPRDCPPRPPEYHDLNGNVIDDPTDIDPRARGNVTQ